MAKGLLGFLGFGKREKPNLVPSFQNLPRAEEAPLFGTLRDFAKKRISGEDGGFGDDFVSLANPSITARQRRFREETLPTISSQASGRGLGRSSLVMNQIGRAERDTQNDIDQMLSQFDYLNRVQKKADITEGLNVGQHLDTEFLNQNSRVAQALNEHELGNTQRTIAQSQARNARSDQMQDRTLQAAGMLTGAAFGGQTGALFGGSAMGGGQNDVQSLLNTILSQKNSNPVKANLSGMSPNAFEQWLNSFLGS